MSKLVKRWFRVKVRTDSRAEALTWNRLLTYTSREENMENFVNSAREYSPLISDGLCIHGK